MNVSPAAPSTLDSNPCVRVFLPTYRRHDLLPRALDSLLAQTHGNWVCELHNDDPQDTYPCELVRRISDARVTLYQHPCNLGPVASFNLFYRPTKEPFYSILEDDNWWESTFLERMIATLSCFPEASLAWCNQRVWCETSDGSWKNTGKLVNLATAHDSSPRLVRWGSLRQLMGGIHANGAMLMRSREGQAYPTLNIPFAAVEAYRERLFQYPLVYMPEPLANFSRTRQTARNEDAGSWGAFQVIMAVSFLRNGAFDTVKLRELWDYCRSQTPPMTNELLAAALICKEARGLIRFAGPGAWLRFCLNAARHPAALFHKLRAPARHLDWQEELDRVTARRFAEAKDIY